MILKCFIFLPLYAWKCMNSKNEHGLLKYLRRFFIVFILFWFTTGNMISQDIHFTLFNNSPLFLNPANTGNFDGNWRITGNYRDQWRAISDKNTYTTASFSFDNHFYISHQKLDAGVYFVNDNSGVKELTANKFYLSLAYEKALNKNVFRFGLQAGYVFRTFGSGKYTLPSDWNMGDGIFTSDNNPAEKKAYADVNIGAIWKTSIKKIEPELGISLAHINFPNESFFNDSKERLPIRYNFHGRMKTKIKDNIYILPSIVYITRKSASEMVAGTNVGFRVFGSVVKELTAGVYIRDGLLKNSDAFSFMGGVTIGRIDLAVCYDYNISGLKVATGNRGAFEISFSYRSISTVLNSYSIPCERY